MELKKKERVTSVTLEKRDTLMEGDISSLYIVTHYRDNEAVSSKSFFSLVAAEEYYNWQLND